ncbi:MAG: DVU_1553 family AMP-dependent CoA ligase [Candidatus Limivicinus sp.]|jgi:phenylacetate-CoA ligase
MEQSLEKGLFELCEKRIKSEPEFKSEYSGETDAELFEKFRLFQLRKTIELAREKSPFYKRLYKDLPFKGGNISGLDDLCRLPFTDGKDLTGNAYGMLCSSQANVEKPVTFYSSGATGNRKRIYFSHADIRKILDFLPRGMNTVVGRTEGRILVMLQNSQGRGIGSILAQSLIEYGMPAWTGDLEDDPEHLYEVTLNNKINVWFGEAISIFRATRILEQKHDLKNLGMKCIFITMCNIPQYMTDYLQRAWNCRVSTHYGLTESGWGLAVDCPECGGYHYDELDHIIEIVDPVSGEIKKEGEYGEIVLTNISRDCMPLIRYRTGDISCIKNAVCGSHLKTLGHIKRRLEGAAIIKGREFYPALFDTALYSSPGLLDYRIFYRGEQLIFEIETLKDFDFDVQGLKGKLMSLDIMKQMPAPDIRLVPEGALRKYCYEKKRIVSAEAENE